MGFDYIEFNNDFKDSVNLYLDLNKADKIRAYVPTKSSVAVLDQYLDGILNQKQQATLLVGPYGKGKSHLLLLLLAAHAAGTAVSSAAQAAGPVFPVPVDLAQGQDYYGSNQYGQYDIYSIHIDHLTLIQIKTDDATISHEATA